MLGKFLGGGSKKQASPKTNKANAFGVDPALFEDPKFDEDDEVDLPQETVDVSGLMKDTEGDANVEVTDEDMNDPDLLAELNEIAEPGYGANEKANKIQNLRDQVAQTKKRALELHKSGDAESARKALTHAKALQAQLEELTGGSAQAPASAPTHAPASTPTPAPAPAKPAPVATKPAPQPVRPAPTPKADDDELPEEDDDDADPGDNKQANEIRARIKTYKLAALTNKQAGNRTAALQYMHSAKLLEKALEDADMGFPVDMKSLPPAVPPPAGDGDDAVPVARSGGSQTSSPVTVMTAAQKEELKRKQTLETLMSELARMAELHKNAALAARDAGDKTGASAALGLMKEAKAQHGVLQAALSDPSIPLPEHHYETKETKTEVAFSNLAPHDLELTFLNIKDLRPPAGYTTLALYVYAEVQFAEKDPVQKIQTPVVNNSLSPVYNHTVKLLIDRNKAFQRYVEKRKLTFHVYHSRFLLGNVLIGKAEMKLSDLLEKAEVQEDIPIIKDGTRRPVGGTLGVRIRLKTPLVKKDVRVTVEKILVIDGAFPSITPSTPTTPTAKPSATPTSTPTAKPAATPTSKTPATPVTPTTATAKSPATPSTPTAKNPASSTTTTTTTPTPTAKPAAPVAGSLQKPAASAQKPAAQAEDELELDDVNSVDNMISNDVLENESAQVDAQLAAYAQKKQPPPEALTDRKQALELKMSILVIQVQSGQITPEKYVEMLQAKVEEERALAKKLVGLGKKDWARYPLQRVKIMQAEIESANNPEDE